MSRLATTAAVVSGTHVAEEPGPAGCPPGWEP
jgi:hypothetical protein